MNSALKVRWANILTAIVAIITIVQGSLLANSPLTPEAVSVVTIVLTYLAMALTAWKQYLSPEVSNKGQNTTIWVAIIATIAGLTDFVGVIHLNDKTADYIKWVLSIVVTVLNILSKQLFPSFDQKVKMNDLKKDS